MSKFLEDWFNAKRDEFYSHVRPELRALAERKERITKAEIPERMNSYEQHILVKNYDNEALAEHAEYCIAKAGRELGEFEIPSHYNEAIERLLAPLLVKRLREAEAELAQHRKQYMCFLPTELLPPPKKDESCEGFEGPCDSRLAEKRTAMTAYNWDGNGEDPNRPPTLCAVCWESYKAYWKGKWDEVRSGAGV